MQVGSIEKAEGDGSTRLQFLDLLSMSDDRSFPGEPILSLEKTMVG